MNPLDRAVYIPTAALETPGTADEIAARSGLPVWPVWRALQRDVRLGRVEMRVVATQRGDLFTSRQLGLTLYVLLDRTKRAAVNRKKLDRLVAAERKRKQRLKLKMWEAA